MNTKAEPNNPTNESEIIEAAAGGGKVIVEIEERLLNKLERGELVLISKRTLSNIFITDKLYIIAELTLASWRAIVPLMVFNSNRKLWFGS